MAKTAAKPLSKMHAVRQALKDLGNDAKPLQLQPYIREKLGVEMSIDHVSTYKSVILRKKAKGKPGPKKAAMAVASSNGAGPAPAGQADLAVKAAAMPAASSLSDQVAMLKQVAGAIGKEEAKKVLDLL
jgi:hypothetical protein